MNSIFELNVKAMPYQFLKCHEHDWIVLLYEYQMSYIERFIQMNGSDEFIQMNG